MTNRRRNLLIVAVCAAWLGAATAGLSALYRYEARPGLAAASPVQWPVPSHIVLDSRKHTLVMFVHPQCSCSVASISQLDHIVARVGDRLAVYVMAVIPEGSTELMVHPGHYGPALHGAPTRLKQSREDELTALCAPEVRDAVRRHDIELTDFRTLQAR